MPHTEAARVTAATAARAPDRAQHDSIGTFAADLRELRHDGGNPTLHALSRVTLISTSVLSEAFAGRRLPTENTVVRLAEALGAEASPWLERRAALQLGGGAPPTVVHPPAPAPRRTAALPRGLVVFLVLVGVLASAILASAVTWMPGQQARSETIAAGAPEPGRSVASLLPPARRADPARTICADDAVVVAGESHLAGAVLVALVHSAQCDAVWGQLVTLGDRLDGRDVTVEVFPADDRYGGRRVSVTATDTATVRTGMIRESSRLEGVCAVVTIAPARGEPAPPETPLCR